MVKEIRIADFDYSLPEERIPVHPLERRDECKLLVRAPKGRIYHKQFKDLPDLLPPGTLLVCNDTKVINARLQFHKETGAAIELFLLEPVEPADYAMNFQSNRHCVWKCIVGNSRKWKEGEIFTELPEETNNPLRVSARRIENEEDGTALIEFTWHDKDYTFARIIESAGKIPIPPYLKRESEKSDLEDYQTVYAREKGSVAAPTAGLHFTPRVFEGLESHNVKVEKMTLHVGAGTFKPVKSEKVGSHAMHSEPFTVSKSLIDKLIEWKKQGKPVVAVGTTSVRTLESLPYIGKKIAEGEENPFRVSQWEPYEGNSENMDTVSTLTEIKKFLEKRKQDSFTASTSIMIAPGFNWQITDGMVTNFHQPKSTLLLLVSSFVDGDWRKMYEEAMYSGYRFLSYGDASLLIRE